MSSHPSRLSILGKCDLSDSMGLPVLDTLQKGNDMHGLQAPRAVFAAPGAAAPSQVVNIVQHHGPASGQLLGIHTVAGHTHSCWAQGLHEGKEALSQNTSLSRIESSRNSLPGYPAVEHT